MLVFEDIPSVDSIEHRQNAQIAFIGHSILCTRCDNPSCTALHVLVREDESEPFLVDITLTVESLEGMLKVARLIKDRRRQ